MRERDEWRARRRRDDGDRDLDAPDPALERFAERVAAPLRAPERADDTFRARLRATVRAEAELTQAALTHATGGEAAAGASREPWYRRSVTVRLTPLRGLAAAAAIGGVMLLGARALERGGGATVASPPRVARSAPPLPDTVRVVQFVFVAPDARRVALVGDFNAWDREATQLQRGGVNGGVWTVSLALPAGRHEYAFVVDGARWEPDPAATDAVTDDFGVVSSVVSVRAAAPRLGAT